MFSPKLLGAVLLAVPLNVAAAQSAASSTNDPPSGPDGHAIFSARTFAWIAGAGASSAAFFTAIATHHADVSPTRGISAGNLSGPSTPSGPTPVTLPFNGSTSPNQNTPSGPPPDTAGNTGIPDKNASGTGDFVLNDLPPSDGIIAKTFTPPPPAPPSQPTPPPDLNLVVVTTPEPSSVALLGSGIIALIPAYRRRRS